MSVRPDVMLGYCTLKIHFPGGIRLWGYRIMQMMALLSWVPSSSTMRARAAWLVAGIPNILQHTKDNSLVVLNWMSCHFGRKKKWVFYFVSVGNRLNTSRLFLSFQPVMASDVAIWQIWLQRLCRYCSESIWTIGQTWLFSQQWGVRCSSSLYCEHVGSIISYICLCNYSWYAIKDAIHSTFSAKLPVMCIYNTGQSIQCKSHIFQKKFNC